MLKKQRDFLRIRHAKEYLDGVRRNPFFFRAPPKRWLMVGGIMLGIALFTFGAIKLTYLPAFRLNTIAVSGTIVILPEDIQNSIRETIFSHGYPLVAKDNVYLINRHAITEQLQSSFALSNVNIVKNGTSLEIHVEERVMTVTLRTKEKTLFLGLDGAYVRDATAEESRAIDIRIGTAVATEGEVIIPLQKAMPIILDTENDPATSLPIESIQHILDISSQLSSRGTIVKTYSFDGATALFTRVDTNESYDLYFDLNNPVSDQMSALAAIMIKPDFVAPAEYIDLRFGAYVYMK